MPKYRTLDQIVVYQNKHIPPYTEVTVPAGDTEIWDELVDLKAAEKVKGTSKKQEPDNEADGAD